MKHELLGAHLELKNRLNNPDILLFGCGIFDGFLTAQLGFITMGLDNRQYNMYNDKEMLVCTILLNPAAVGLPDDLWFELSPNDVFPVLKYHLLLDDV